MAELHRLLEEATASYDTAFTAAVIAMLRTGVAGWSGNAADWLDATAG